MPADEPEPAFYRAEFFDGNSALSRAVHVRTKDNLLILEDPEAGTILTHWPMADTRWISGEDKPVLSTADTPDARLVLESPELAKNLLALYPDLKGHVQTERSQRTHVLAWRFGIVAAVLTVLVFIAVPWLSGPLAQLATDDWRQRIGSQSVAQIEALLGERCNNEPGQTALTALANKLARQLPKGEILHVGTIDNAMVNAFALTGGHIRFMRGLIDKARGPDEVAGVLAHEIAHVALRHAEEQIFRQLGYQIVLSTIGDSGAMTEIAAAVGVQLINAAHSREAETAADNLAIEILTRANISRRGMVSFFSRIEKMEGQSPKFLKYLSSHPASGARKKAAAASQGSGEPAMSDQDWQALKKICD